MNVSKKITSILIVGILFIGLSSAMTVNYYFSPDCSHCKKIAPFIDNVVLSYPEVIWNLLDINKGSYAISGTPTLTLNTNDEREITMVGSYEIPKLLECEINEMSTLDCPTTTDLNCETSSFFIRE